MRFTHLLTLCAALLALPTMARAEDTPPPPANPAPAPAAHTEVQPKARKEEEGETTTAGLLSRLKAWGTGKNELADEIASLKQALTESQATIATLQSEKEALAKENAALRKDVGDFAAWMEAREGTAPSGSTPEGRKAAEAIGAGVAAVVRKIGVNVAEVPSAAAAGGANTNELLEAAIAEMTAETDPAKRGLLAAKVRTLREQAAKQPNN